MMAADVPGFWLYLWIGLLALGFSLFAGLSIVVSIGAFFDIMDWLGDSEQTRPSDS